MALLKSAHGGNIREAAALLGIAPGELLDFSANINPLGMPASLREAIVDNPGCAERYPDVEYQQLHQALAAHHQLPAAHILAGNGETESIFTLVHGLKPRRTMIVIPGFAEYRRALQTVDCEVVEYALRAGAVAVVLAHNHPSGVALPSQEDCATTRLIRDALRTMNIQLVDHIIVADRDYVSMAASGLLI